MKRKNHSTDTIWEPLIGYSRAVRVGDHIYVSGTTSTNTIGEVVGMDAYTQTVVIIENIKKALEALGAGLKDVVRTRIYVTNIADWEKVGKAHREYFDKIRPVTSMVEVSRFISKDILVEIEADAFISSEE